MKKELGIHVVVLQRGWVVIGELSSIGNQYEMRKTAVIRNWGTTKGLGELVKSGPLPNTKLDPTNGVVRFHKLTVVMRVKCSGDVWSKHLS
jgi:hypothetical protein